MPVAVGVVVGLTLGLTGAGGSLVAVPLLVWALGWSLPQAAPVALLAVATAAALGTWVAWRQAYVRYRAALLMGLVGMATAPLGMRVAALLPATALTVLFAALMIYVAVRMYRQSVTAPAEAGVVRAIVAGDGTRAAGPICRLDPRTGRIRWTRACALVLAGVGGAAGLLAGLLGVGGGFVIVPALRAVTELSVHSAVATSLMTIALTAGGAVAIAAATGADLPWDAALPFVAGALAGMVAARYLAPRVAGPHLQRGFAGVMVAAALVLIARAFG